MEKDETRFTMRINNKLWEKIKILAQKSKRSAVKEIEYIFDLLFGNSDNADLVEHFDEIEKLVKELEKMNQQAKDMIKQELKSESNHQSNEKSA